MNLWRSLFIARDIIIVPYTENTIEQPPRGLFYSVHNNLLTYIIRGA